MLCVCGLAAGYSAKRLVTPPTAETDELISEAEKITRSSRNVSAPTTYIAPEVKSTDTVESLIEKGETATFNDLATWLLTASSEEIATYWAACKDLKPHKFSRNLIFMNWARTDPQGALAATAGTEHEKMAWSGWASNDPDAALAAVSPKFLSTVAHSIGQHHPQWVRDHFDEIPEEGRQAALHGITTWKENSDHEGTLDFLRENGRNLHEGAFRTLVRKDPWAAYDWLEKNGLLTTNTWGRSTGDTFIQTMLENHPEDLERLASMTPSGQMKWRMEDAIFESLLSADKEAALKNARKTEASLIAAKRLALIGETFLETDPEKAFALGGEILDLAKSRLSPELDINTDRGGTRYGSSEDAAEDYMRSLLRANPERVMNMLVDISPKSDAFSTLSHEWAEKDVDGLASWTNQQDDPQIRSRATDTIVGRLSAQDRFEEAAGWALSNYAETKGTSSMYQLLYKWNRTSPDQAAQWLQNVDIDEPTRERMNSILERDR